MKTISLSKLKVVQGTETQAPEGTRAFLPEENGAVCLSFPVDHAEPEWSKNHYLTVEFCARMDRMAVMFFDFIEHTAQGEKRLTIRYFLVPKRRVKMAVSLSELDSHRFFLPTYPGTLKGHVEGEPTDISRIDEVRVRLNKNDTCEQLALYSLTLSEALPDMRVQGEAMVDAFGQRTDAEWPLKIHSEEELVKRLRQELENAKAHGDYPADYSRYGGWLKRSFDKTGFFHTHFDGRRWWLVDPDGYAFISNGMCYGSRMGVHGFVDGMEPLFEWLPNAEDETWRDCWTEASEIAEFVKRNGKESGKGRKMFNFARANMIRAFGAQGWWDAWVTINAARMKRWGMNTIGVGVNNYVDERVMEYLKKAQIPYVWTLKEFPLTKPCIYRDFPDVFSPEYQQGAERFAREQLAPFVNDPYMIGYFITNEPEWLFQASVNPAERVLSYPGHLYSKDALIDFLRAQYGEIARLNEAWGLSLASFDELNTPIERADTLSEAAARDLNAFRDVLIKKYSQVPSDALHQVDPNHLNLGMRYSKLTDNELAGNGCFDICSFNCYQPDPFERFEIVKTRDQRPGLIGEWHIAGGEKSHFATGLVWCKTQQERANACRYFMERSFAHEACVGAHYFEMNDQPVLGRFDGECMQHGVITLCNIAYPEMDEMFRELARHLYPLAAGEEKMTAQPVPTQDRLG